MRQVLLVLALLVQPAALFANEPTLIGGTAADPKDWPASVYASMSNARCSATVVGERTLLIAAHCVSNGGRASFSAGANAYASKCTHHREYRGNSTADWTLCLTDKKVEGVPYELILVEAGDTMKVGTEAQLTGYGCIRPGGGGGNDGVFRIGFAPVKSLPSGRNYDTVTSGKSALCFGDSGGAAYVWDAEKKVRRIFGVNSRGDISKTSYLSSTYVKSFVDFAKEWAQANGQKICGVHEDATGCRTQSSPPTPTEFTVDTAVAGGTLKMKPGKELLLQQAKDAVTQALEELKD